MGKVTVHKGAQGETPSESIVKAANKPILVTDTLGRSLGVRKMLLLDRMRMFEVIGPENSKNEAYVGYSALAFSVVSIDGDPVARPANKIQLEALVQRLGDEGIEAVAEHFASEAAAAASSPEDEKAALKNGSSTPS
ncbi:hypothetical protein OJF2_50880 [Aquisphaera giovannonii]|uniref:Uncharacterized protein n=1 Tax=Aquisphaera giovannonii TaxID=406548 RepID=A0A5B9W8E2_9BACT|nr:hypothetical protein [Aquisphaera giovannonii]QEH36504.1 hypothetical protein OJF2_50880 [Aquisphaera giovannonii]